jgi:putative Mg2+ transporter-C (MgtC) family protein
MNLPDLPWSDILRDSATLAGAYLLAVPIGFNRERWERSAGIRTFPIVALASCGLALIANRIPGATPDTYSRILQGLITGIGFVGAGAILKERGTVSGTATAASVWNVGVIGAATGLALYHIAVVLAVVNYLTLRYLKSMEMRGDRTGKGPFASHPDDRDPA